MPIIEALNLYRVDNKISPSLDLLLDPSLNMPSDNKDCEEFRNGYPVTPILYGEDLVLYASFKKEETFKTLLYHLVIDSAQILFVDSVAW